MKPRELAALLKNLRANGVTRYVSTPEGGVEITLGDISTPEPVSAGGDQEQEDGPLLVPAGVFDPLAKLREINAKQRGPS